MLALLGAFALTPILLPWLVTRLGADPGEVLFVGDTWGPDVVGPLENFILPGGAPGAA